MNHTEQFLRDIYEGGYRIPNNKKEYQWKLVTPNRILIWTDDKSKKSYYVNINRIIIDPLAWQSYCNVRGVSDPLASSMPFFKNLMLGMTIEDSF